MAKKSSRRARAEAMNASLRRDGYDTDASVRYHRNAEQENANMLTNPNISKRVRKWALKDLKDHQKARHLIEG